ncbi:MAG: hypothetical protein EOO99_10160 [Pedobacter sp.]|nr:MAG: hypothetical protein EOO99_10160 [Pedobacter sp.]
MDPYYQLAQQYNLPIGVHTGGAGPDHGSPHFRLEMGNPNLWRGVLDKFPDLKIWLMHVGVQFYKEAIAFMKLYPQVYADLSVISDPDIIEPDEFSVMLDAFISNGLEDRLMFGSDNADINKMINSIHNHDNLTPLQKDKIFYKNAEVFFKN